MKNEDTLSDKNKRRIKYRKIDNKLYNDIARYILVETGHHLYEIVHPSLYDKLVENYAQHRIREHYREKTRKQLLEVLEKIEELNLVPIAKKNVVKDDGKTNIELYNYVLLEKVKVIPTSDKMLGVGEFNLEEMLDEYCYGQPSLAFIVELKLKQMKKNKNRYILTIKRYTFPFPFLRESSIDGDVEEYYRIKSEVTDGDVLYQFCREGNSYDAFCDFETIDLIRDKILEKLREKELQKKET